MSDFKIIKTQTTTVADLATARLGSRFGRMDISSQLALLAVEPLAGEFESIPRERIAILLGARSGSLPTDVNFWDARDGVGGLSPTLFTYTLPSAAIGEIAIRHRITGPNLCTVGDDSTLKREAEEMLRRNEALACVCVFVDVVTPAVSKLIGLPKSAKATATFIRTEK